MYVIRHGINAKGVLHYCCYQQNLNVYEWTNNKTFPEFNADLLFSVSSSTI